MSYYPSPAGPVSVHAVDVHGRKIGAPYQVVRRSPWGPGYDVLGTMQGVSATVRAIALTPHNPARWHPSYNGRVRYGYRTIADAKEAARMHLGVEATWSRS